MANIMKMLGLKNKPTRDGYDLQKTLAFTAKPGELLPIYNRTLMPGDKLKIDATWRTRTAPLNRAAFTNFKEYYDWFFVPYNVLWKNYNEWSVNLKDQLTSASSINSTQPLLDDHPYIDVSDLENVLHVMSLEDTGNRLNEFGFERYKLTIKLLHYLGYGDFSHNQELMPEFAPSSLGRLSPWPLLAYQKVYYDHYRFSQWEQSKPGAFNVDYLDGSNTNGLRIPLERITATVSGPVYQPNSMLELRYANWNKDMFMGLLPNAQYGDAASVDLSSIVSTLGTDTSIQFDSNLSASGQNVLVNGSNKLASENGNIGWWVRPDSLRKLANGLGLTTANLQSAFTILALRQAEALQKYKEIKQSQELDFPSQTEAHFGVRPNSAYSRKSVRIASFDGVVGISDVDNTNITENSDGSVNEATVAGKGYARGNGKGFTFSTDVPGVIMCIYHVKPILEYALPRVSPDILKTRYTDYAIPEFDRTGMQQIPLVYLLSRFPYIDGKIATFIDEGLLGYAPIYLDYKTDIDEVKGAFYNGGLESWVAPLTIDYVKNWFKYDEGRDMYLFQGLNTTFFKVNPSVLNPIFASDMDSDVSSDKFWTQVHFSINAVRPLDRNGLPY